ncbi:flattop-like protein [Trichonephila clavipes]|nr:flattop-like protein [Trichonephila clavipes]
MKEGRIASSYECPKCNDRYDVTWWGIKRFLRNRISHTEGVRAHCDHYLAEYIWLRSHDHSLSDETFKAFLKSVTLYPPLGEDQQFLVSTEVSPASRHNKVTQSLVAKDLCSS